MSSYRRVFSFFPADVYTILSYLINPDYWCVDVAGISTGVSQATQYHSANRTEPSTKRIIYLSDLSCVLNLTFPYLSIICSTIKQLLSLSFIVLYLWLLAVAIKLSLLARWEKLMKVSGTPVHALWFYCFLLYYFVDRSKGA